jgi:lycopene beta-cyclase
VTGQPLDIAFIGGSLSNCLAAATLSQLRPDIRWHMFESNPRVGGHHTWCFHEDHLPFGSQLKSWLISMADATWDQHDVQFPSLRRTLTSTYHCIRSESFAFKFERQFGEQISLNAKIRVHGGQFVCGRGKPISARQVIDGRELSPTDPRSPTYFKFVGAQVRCIEPHHLARPILMDTRIPQMDGYRYFQVLPVSEQELLIKDCRYSTSTDFGELTYLGEIRRYAKKFGWLGEVNGVEKGLIPLPLRLRVKPHLVPGAVQVGLNAGHFHASLGTSIGEAGRFAQWLGSQEDLLDSRLPQKINRYSNRQWKSQTFYRRLNARLFLGPADKRYEVMERLFGMDEDVITRFYQRQLTRRECQKIMGGAGVIQLLGNLFMGTGADLVTTTKDLSHS